MRKPRSNQECVPQSKLLEIFTYSQGKLFWIVESNYCSFQGKEAGYVSPCGYCYITVNNVRYKRSRLVWAFHNGWPASNLLVDHINRDKSDDNINNLRLVSVAENRWNSNNIKGYTYEKDRQKYKVTIMAYSKRVLIGRYDTEEDAREAYNRAKLKYHQIGQTQGCSEQD